MCALSLLGHSPFKLDAALQVNPAGLLATPSYPTLSLTHHDLMYDWIECLGSRW